MNRRISVALLTLILLAGCGNPAKQQEEVGSFALSSSVPLQTATAAVNTDATSTGEAEQANAAGTREITEPVSDSVEPGNTPTSAEPVKGEADAASNVTQPTEEPAALRSNPAKADTMKADLKEKPAEAVKEVNSASPEGKNAPKKTVEPQKADPIPVGGISQITWSQFFDNEDQTTPSEHFWDLSGSKVEINGYMGEVLSFEKNWFLLIPKPGAECPFDNGDETYWNKIMIVFVPDDVNLRHHTGPLKITGRLDVGIKIDESGYKTMFRLYDASFEEIKE